MDLPVLTQDSRGDFVAKVTWLGTAGFAVESLATGHVVLVDPYVTRASLVSCALGALEPDRARCARMFPRADAVVLGHTHFDHALDAPEIALRTGALVLGSRSAAVLCRASGVAEEKIRVVERDPGSDPVELDVGPFHLRFSPSAHSKFALGRVPFPGDIADCDDVPLRVERYRCGAVFTIEIEIEGRRITHVGSAEVIGERHRPSDLLLLCAAGWRSTPDLPERAVRAFDPRAVLLSHWDDFFRSLDRDVRALPAIGAQRLADRLMRASRDARVGAVPLLGALLV